MPRYFRVEEAEKLLPRVEQDLRQAIHLKQEHEKAEGQLQAIAQKIQMMGGMLLNRTEVLGKRARRDALVMRLKEVIEEIHGVGCQIKDLDTGLIDFPTLFQGEEVLLCWKLGETGITHWHGMHEGFQGRKPIDEEFRLSHRGDLEE